MQQGNTPSSHHYLRRLVGVAPEIWDIHIGDVCSLGSRQPVRSRHVVEARTAIAVIAFAAGFDTDHISHALGSRIGNPSSEYQPHAVRIRHEAYLLRESYRANFRRLSDYGDGLTAKKG